jgi:superfamily II RNA helicase
LSLHTSNMRLKEFFPTKEALEKDASGVLLDRFVEWTSKTGLNLYPAQEEAIMALYAGQNVILNTPTGSGKSLVATALHFASLAQGRRSFYTCPIKALANEKFLSLAAEFGPENVGMMTGDASVNPTAPIICCTAEILSNLTLREGYRAEVDDVVMDEFHFFSDRERGVAWQVPLLELKLTRFLLMSATLGDVEIFQKKLTALNGFETALILGGERPVPLDFKYVETPLHETIQDLVLGKKSPVYLVNFTQRDCAETAQDLMSIDFCSKEEKQALNIALNEVRFSSPYGQELKRILKHGIGIHHAGLLPKYRVVVEKLAQRGMLKVICGTDTLGVGVNVPIRTVLLTKLCKYDGQKTALLTVRDFHQIVGRAGRKGFDDIGYVVCQAPEHVIENLRMEMKAAGDPKKVKKIVKKKPPEHGFVIWTKDTFEKLQTATPESLVSRFNVDYGMLLNVLSRPGDGCREMQSLVRKSFESDYNKANLRRRSFQLFRSLLDKRIVDINPNYIGSQNSSRGDENNHGVIHSKIRVHVDLQADFSLFHELSIFLVDTVKRVDPYSETYALDILSLAESIVEDPDVVLRRQLDKLKTIKMAEMKSEGLEYEERIAELEKLEYPKPNREFIYQTFNEFTAMHPWLDTGNIKPKSIVREMYEGFMTFGEYVREYGLERSEGVLLRHLAQVYKVLVQTVPKSAKDEDMESIIDYLGGTMRQVDSSLLEEWERLRTGQDKNPSAAIVANDIDVLDVGASDITKNKNEFLIAIGNECFFGVKLLAAGRIKEFADWAQLSIDQMQPMVDQYLMTHEGPLDSKDARKRSNLIVTKSSDDLWQVDQILIDEDQNNDVAMRFDLKLSECRELGHVKLNFVGLKDL